LFRRLKNVIWDSIVAWLIAIPEANQNLSAINNQDKLLASLQPADVLLFEGRTRVGEIIKLITLSPWIHSALYVGRLSEIKDPVTKTRVRKFYNGDPNQQLVIEPTYIKPADKKKVICFAAEHLGLAYDIRQLLDLARFFFPYGILPRHWRSSLFQHNAGKPTHVVCSGMIARCFQSVSYPILPVVVTDDMEQKKIYKRHFRLFVPADFDYSPYFEIVKYPELDLSEANSASYLPWEEADEHTPNIPITAARRSSLTPSVTSKNKTLSGDIA